MPVLWDTQSATIVNNESADILRMLSTVFHELAEQPIELYPERLRGEIDALDARLADCRFLFGPEPLETDWRLFTTLVRFDAVYQLGRRRPNKY